jgi:hypothetical protein
MNQSDLQSNFTSAQNGRIAFLLLSSIFSSGVIATGAANAESTIPLDRNSANKVTVSAAVSETALSDRPLTTVAPTTTNIAQASDVAGNWAEPFIKVLVEKGIIAGYPDGTFKPDQAVTRAEFAALINKAFDLQPVRSGRKFKDVPTNYWAAEVIQKAYKSGFIAGYPNGTFAPKQNILRIQSLVSLINGSKLESANNLDLNSVFGDAAQVPSYGQAALVAATQRCIAVSAEYDSSKLPGGNFGANTVATRADVAAYVHQVLVGAGKLTALDKSSPANKYIASCPQGIYVTSISGNSQATVLVANEAISRLSIPGQLPTVATTGATAHPVNGLLTPTAFGANWGDVFLGLGYQATSRGALYFDPPQLGQRGVDGAAYVGFGIGDSRNFVGLETVAASFSTFQSGFLNKGTFSFKLHKQFGENFAIAGGYENAISWNQTPSLGLDGGTAGYGVASFVVNPDANMGFFSNTTLSVGAGGGRFRSVGDIRNNKDSNGVFGSLGTRLSPNFSLVADWNGQDLAVGLPITIYLGDSTSVQVVPSMVDLVNKETSGSRFTLNGGLGFHF